MAGVDGCQSDIGRLGGDHHAGMPRGLTGGKMQILLRLSRSIDRLSIALGQWVAWAIVVSAILSAMNAVVRKVFDYSSNSLLEMQWWLFALVFLMASPWTLAQNEHIRIDVLNHRFPQWMKNAVELLGHIFFLIPSAAMLTYTSWHYFMTSYAQNEQSSNAGGLPQWPIKFLIPAAFALLFFQGLSELIKRIAIMRGDIPEPEASKGAYHDAAAPTGDQIRITTNMRSLRNAAKEPRK